MGVKISNLPLIVTPATTDIFAVVQGGVTYQESMTQLSSLLFNSPTIVTPKMAQINDINGLPEITLTAIASSVNYFNISNAATGNNPTITATGSDSNVGYAAITKGTGKFVLSSANTTQPIIINSGTGLQHITTLNFSDTAATRAITIPDFAGTVILSNKVNGVEAANAVTASGTAGVITTASLTTASGAEYAITWTNTFIGTTSIITLSLMGGTNTRQTIQLRATAGAGTSTLTITNNNASALNGTLFIGYTVIT